MIDKTGEALHGCRLVGCNAGYSSDVTLASEDADAEAEMLATQQAQHVQAAMAELPDEQKLIIEMAFQQSLTQSEIATRLALPLGTIKSRMRLAYQKLRVTLEDVK